MRMGNSFMMKKLCHALAVVGLMAATPAFADNQDPLFINLTTDEGHRADMAMVFSKAVMERGHPVTLWLNDKSVLMAAKGQADKFGAQQALLAELIGKGATVIACPICMRHYGVNEADLLAGIKVGNPDLTSGLLFKDDTKTLTW